MFCPTSNVTCVERDASNTPLGALVTLNNKVFVEAARKFAELVIASNETDDESRIAFMLRRCIARVPSHGEVARIADLLAQSRDYYAKHADQAKTLVGREDVELSAWTTVTRVALNLDEFITRE